MADRGVVLSLCDRTGVMVQPWLEAGYRCVIVDLQHPAGDRLVVQRPAGPQQPGHRLPDPSRPSVGAVVVVRPAREARPATRGLLLVRGDVLMAERGREAAAGPWCPVCRQPVPETGMAWTFPPHGDCEGAGRKVRDVDHGFVTEDGRTVPEWEYGVTPPARETT